MLKQRKQSAQASGTRSTRWWHLLLYTLSAIAMFVACIVVFTTLMYPQVEWSLSKPDYIPIDSSMESTGLIDVSGLDGIRVGEKFVKKLEPYWSDVYWSQPVATVRKHYSAYGADIVIYDDVRFKGKAPRLPDDKTIILIYDEIPAKGELVADGDLARVRVIAAVPTNTGRASFWVVPKDWENPEKFQLSFIPTTY
jgi:hypothetical protein